MANGSEETRILGRRARQIGPLFRSGSPEKTPFEMQTNLPTLIYYRNTKFFALRSTARTRWLRLVRHKPSSCRCSSSLKTDTNLNNPHVLSIHLGCMFPCHAPSDPTAYGATLARSRVGWCIQACPASGFRSTDRATTCALSSRVCFHPIHKFHSVKPERNP